MSLAVLCWGMAERRSDGSLRGIYKTFAFLGRYGHQRVGDLMKLPVSELRLLADEVNELIKQENDPLRRKMETDGV